MKLLNYKRRALQRAFGFFCVFVSLASFSGCADLGAPVESQTPGSNVAPRIEPIGERFAAVNNPFSLIVSASDAESIPSLIALKRPAGALFVDSGNGRGLLSWTPATSFANTTNAVTIIATDDSLTSDTEIVVVNVIDYTYDNFVAPQVTTFCMDAGCHGNGSNSGNFSAISYMTFVAGGFSGVGIAPRDTASSVVFKRLQGTSVGSRMPLDARIPGNGFFQQSTLDSLARWILAGAPET